MSNWIEEERERRLRAETTGMTAAFTRCVQSGELQDSPSARVAFARGWVESSSYKYAVKENNQAASGSRSFALLFGLFGGMLIALVIFMCLIIPTEELVTERLIGTVLVGIGLIGLAYLSYLRAQAVCRKADEDFHNEWGEPAAQKAVDE